MNQRFDSYLGRNLVIGRMRSIGAGLTAPDNHTNEAEVFAAASSTMKNLSALLLCAAFTLCPAFAQTSLKTVNLGAAAPFAVLAGSGVTNVGFTVITGDLGVWPVAGTAVTGFSGENAGGPGKVIGTIEDNDSSLETSAARAGSASLGIAINDAKGRTGAFTPENTDLVGKTLKPGLYRSSGTLTLTGGAVYLSGRGVYIFQVATGLIVGVGSSVVLENGARAQDIFWQVGTKATLNTGVKFYGNILAGTAITMGSGVAMNGRALAQTNVTFITDTVTIPRTGN